MLPRFRATVVDLPVAKSLELEPCLVCRLIDIVDALLANRERHLNDPFQHLHGLAAGGWKPPQGTRLAPGLRVIDVGAVWRLEGHEPDVMCDLDWLPTGHRELPDLILSGSIGAEVDPLAVPGETGDAAVGRMKGEAARLTARGGDYIDVVVAFDIGIERNQLAVGRPAAAACPNGHPWWRPLR